MLPFLPPLSFCSLLRGKSVLNLDTVCNINANGLFSSVWSLFPSLSLTAFSLFFMHFFVERKSEERWRLKRQYAMCWRCKDLREVKATTCPVSAKLSLHLTFISFCLFYSFLTNVDVISSLLLSLQEVSSLSSSLFKSLCENNWDEYIYSKYERKMTIKRKEDSKKKRILLDAEEKRERQRKTSAILFLPED